MPIELNRIAGFRCFEKSIAIDTTATGPQDYFFIPPDADRVSVQIKVLSTAAVTVEATVSTIDELVAGTAEWKAWDNGSVTAGAVSQDATKGPVSGVRVNVLTALAGNNAMISIKCQRGTP